CAQTGWPFSGLDSW
nr:immunoglobulin heavy chain junction region [Macaca mulatta]MOX37932.1 immunoglobulin heavy chain junction region [Macaca mulatta]MOX39716.1 immunoglobulin heavy chain junction region [Macaca mulatta]MOX39971.1 immunoglobulin heavy chain junction region [Macaca mulatta]MOX40062.1 immunoglobulin heavy chain junction region [Macaca mulatta]